MCINLFFFRGVSFDSAIEIQPMIIPESDKPIIKLQNLLQPEPMEQLSFKSYSIFHRFRRKIDVETSIEQKDPTSLGFLR